MPQFTLAEAAKELGIKKESVYKRVQRGSLQHIKGSDGILYVRLDDLKPRSTDGNDDGVGTSNTSARSRNEPSAWNLTDLSALAALVGAVTTMIYVSGLFVLWAPITIRYTHDVATAWYAVSLIPKTSVIGLGFISFWYVVLLSMVTFGLLILLLESETPLVQKIQRGIGRAIGWLGALFAIVLTYLIARYAFDAIQGAPPQDLRTRVVAVVPVTGQLFPPGQLFLAR